jgi:hydrogenase-4 component B
VFIGLGLALAFRATAFQAGAAFALTAALFHALNHTVFKSLLFFGAGAVLDATGERDIKTMGGLIHRMPRTSFAFLTGCAAIAGLPPLNGFASEWLTFQAVLVHPEMPEWGLKLIIPVDGAALALAAALAAACFVRAFGVVFLGRARSEAANQARETDTWSAAAMLAFALLCLMAGIFRGAVIDTIAPVTRALLGARMPEQLGDVWMTIAPVEAGRSSYNGLLVFAFIGASMLLASGIVHRLGSRAVRRAGVGLRLSGPGTRQPVLRRVSPSRSGGCLARWYSGRATPSTCRRLAITALPASFAASVTRSGILFMPRSGGASAGSPIIATSCNS